MGHSWDKSFQAIKNCTDIDNQTQEKYTQKTNIKTSKQALVMP